MLINERDPKLGEDEIVREALNLMENHVRAASALSLSGPKSERSELEQLRGKSREFADALESLSFQAQLELRYISGSEPIPDLKRLQLDAKNRPRDVWMESLIGEAVIVFEKAMGINLSNLSNRRSQNSKKIIHNLNQFVRTFMPEPEKYSSESQFKTLSKRVSRHLTNPTN